MTLSLKADHLKRYRDFLRLWIKYGHSDLVKHAGFNEALDPGQSPAPADAGKPEELANDLENLGPSFIKIGQLLSTRADFLSLPYLDALSRLQDKVEPFPFEQVRQIVHEELGIRISKAFSSFEERPIAAASLGQVHLAALRDGSCVAVKVQRPDIRQGILRDLEAFGEVARVLDKHTDIGRRYEFEQMVEEFRKVLLRELDYRLEAENLVILGANMEKFKDIVVPRPVEDYCTAKVLTMEHIRGSKITTLSPIVRIEMKGRALAESLFRAYLQQIVIDGFFHADPHPGNIFITGDGRLAFLDLGMVARLSPVMQEDLLKLILAVSEGRGDDAAALGIAMGRKMDFFDEQALRRRVNDLVNQFHGRQMQEMQIGQVVMGISRAAADHGLRVPQEFTLLGKTLMNLDIAGRTLDPKFDPSAAVRRYATDMTMQRLIKGASLGNVMQELLEVKEFIGHLPGRVNRVLDRIAHDDWEVKVDAIDEKMLMEGFQKVANRIASGLILAAIIVGAAMLMRIQTSWKIFDYPGLAIILFIGAATGGLLLLINIFIFDERHDSKHK